MEKKTMLVLMCVLLMLMTMISPAMIIPITSVRAWVYQDGTPSDTLFERFGPRADQLWIQLYPYDIWEWEGLKSGYIDITDSPLTLDYFEQFIQPPYSDNINIIDYVCEFSFYMLDINNNNNEYLGNPPDPDYPNPVYPNPCSVLGFRQAIAYLVNRSYIVDITKGLGIPIWTPMPPSLSTFVHPDIKPGGVLENLTYGGWTGDINKASELLDMNGFPIGDDGWRFWDRDGYRIYLELKLVIPIDDTYARLVGEFIASRLEAVKIRVNRIYRDERYAQILVMGRKDFHLYIGHYVTGSDPTFLSNWNWRYYWHPGKPNNYDGINNATFNEASDGVRYAQTESDAISSCFLAQEVFAQNALSVPLFSVHGYKAMSRRYVGSEAPYTGNYWEGVVNIQGYGIDNYWSFLNMHPQGYMLGDGSMTIRWGLSTPSIDSLNPLTAKTEEAWKILDLIYEPLIRRDPYYTFELIPWLAESFMPGIYPHPKYGNCTKIAFTIQPEAYWSDGTPITTYDVYFTLVELPRILKDRSPMVWTKEIWFEIWEDIIDFTLLDPYNFEVLFNCTSMWALDWISEIPILPAHIWKPIAESGDPTSFAPDPNMIGSGPWRFVEYMGNDHVFLVANKPGSTVKTDLPGSTPVTSPGYFRYYPIEPGGYFFESSPQTKKHKIPPSSGRIAKAFKSLVQKFKDILGDWLPNVDIEVYLYVNGNKEPNYPRNFTLGDWTQLPEIAYTIYREFEAGLTRVKIEAYATFYYDTPFGRLPLLNHEKFSDPTILWFTIYEDIVGSNFYDDMNYTAYPYKNYLPTPDFKVDIYDLVIIALAFDSVPGDSRWSPVADLNADYRIDIFDLVLVALKFGWQG